MSLSERKIEIPPAFLVLTHPIVAYKNTMNDDSQFCLEEGILSPICAPAFSLVLRNKFQCAKYQESMTCSLLERTKKMEKSPKIEKGLDVEQPHIESSCMKM